MSAVLAALWWGSACLAITPAAHSPLPQSTDAQGVFVLDGRFVHRVGELQLNITNWGLIGSHPGLQRPYSDAPSAMWPAGSGVDYVFAAGWWIGAIKNGIPAVSTGQPVSELLPTGDPLDTIYELSEHGPGAARYPSPDFDDDGDGQANEDPRDGHDNDGDGRLDEDDAGIGDQHLRFTVRDDTRLAAELNPDHNPLGIELTQDSYQWASPRLDDAIIFELTIKNRGDIPLEGVVVGFYMDADIGPRDHSGIARDDLVGYSSERVFSPERGQIRVSLAYMYDCDGDDGRAPGYIGVLTISPATPNEPLALVPRAVRFFRAQAPFESGGRPTNDLERYEALSVARIDEPVTDCRQAGDYQVLVAAGGAGFLAPRASTRVAYALVAGAGLDELRRNAEEVMLAYYGAWFNRDGNPSTGRLGRERRVCAGGFPPSDAFLDRFVDCQRTFSDNVAPLLIRDLSLDSDLCAWISDDCAFEEARGVGGQGPRDCFADGLLPETELVGCTGLGGREFNVRWWSGDAAPASPALRVWEAHRRVHLFWDDRSELSVDARFALPNFESYRLWRADGWDRPFGTSTSTGPSTDLWQIVAEYDVIDSAEFRRPAYPGGPILREWGPLGSNTGLDALRYLPDVLREDSRAALELAPLAALVDRIVDENPGLTRNDRVRARTGTGEPSPLAERYPELLGWECCIDQLDTLYLGRLGVKFYEYVDGNLHDGIHYFHAVTATAFAVERSGGAIVPVGGGEAGSPRGNFRFTVPNPAAQTAAQRAAFGQDIYVVPNPATRTALAEFSQLHPNADDPTGVRVEFRNLPQALCTIRIFTLAGDRVEELIHEGSDGDGSAAWNLVSRNGQEVASGIYLFSVETAAPGFERVVGRFVVIR